ncbi:MAG: DMT family transporter [Candidatus Contendobacter sp.]|nr:DMT family transporter [Candidatus Contendobacter sp.]
MNPLVFACNPAVYLIAAMLIWGSSFAAMKLAVAVYDPILITFVRLLIASGVFWGLRRWFGPIRYRQGDWRWLMLMALFEPVLYFALEANALRFTSSAAAATVIALLPLSVALAAQWLLHETVSGRLYAGVLASVVGVILLTGSDEQTALSPQPWLGNALEFLAMLCAVGYTLAVKRLSAHYPALFLTAAQAFIGSVLYLPLLPFVEITGVVDGPAMLAVLYLGAVVSVLAYLCYNHALGQLPASQVAAYSSLVPVFAAFFGWRLLDETLTMVQGIAILLVLAGVIYSQTRVATLDPQPALNPVKS